MTRKDARSKLETERNRKLYVGGLPYDITKEELGNYFSVFGELEYANIVYSVGSTLPRGFGFIKFESPETVMKVLAQPKIIIQGREVSVKAFEIFAEEVAQTF